MDLLFLPIPFPEQMLAEFNREFPGTPVLGGLACGTRQRKKTTLFHNHSVIETGAVGIAIGGDVVIESLISQGCLPVGDSYTITSVEKNILDGIANRKAYEVLSDVFDELPDSMKLKSRGNLHVGFVVDEYLHEFQRGDFLVRNLIGADPARGALLVGALPRVGQTVQFQLRDRHSAMEDIRARLEVLRERLASREVYGALLTSCTGRGKAFFKVPDFDASTIQEQLGTIGMAGFFGNGE
jgi:small ligand-binding sensory domain FIST